MLGQNKPWASQSSLNGDELKALIFNIQRFSLHDGPGIRTTVFFKGCPLRCRWCCNPESWHPFPEIMTRDIKCIKCGKCQLICPSNAITIDEKRRKIHRVRCTRCLKCAEVCATEAISVAGKCLSLEEVMAEAEADRPFFETSGGGVTASGGEPLLQGEFVCQFLKACKEKGLHTALDTCGYAPWNMLEKVLEYTDLVLYDLKHLNPLLHKQGTGKSNLLILHNAQRVTSEVRTWLRVPLIPGYNDSEEHLRSLGEFAARLKVEKISLLPYHRLGKAKYHSLGKRYFFGPVTQPDSEYLEKIRRIVETSGRRVTVGN